MTCRDQDCDRPVRARLCHKHYSRALENHEFEVGFEAYSLDRHAEQITVTLLGPDGEWADHAACLDAEPDTFFPEKGGSTAAAKVICSGCAVREPCLDYALANSERYGVWGGLSERERRLLRRSVA